MSDTKDFDTAINRLNKDLKDLESVSKHLNEVEKFAGQTKEIGEKFEAHLEYSAGLIENSTAKLNSFVKASRDDIKALTKSHEELRSTVKDMEDKVTVLNTKTEAISKELSLKIDQVEKELAQKLKRQTNISERNLAKQIEEIQNSRNLIIYTLIPVILLLIVLVLNNFI